MVCFRQELLEQIVRQRDMFKRLFQDATAGAASQATPAGAARLLPAPPQPGADASAEVLPTHHISPCARGARQAVL